MRHEWSAESTLDRSRASRVDGEPRARRWHSITTGGALTRSVLLRASPTPSGARFVPKVGVDGQGARSTGPER